MVFVYYYYRYVGFYKGVQSAGAAVAWQVDRAKVSWLSQLIINWSLTTLSYPLLAVLVLLAVKDDEQPQQQSDLELPPQSNKAVSVP